MVRISKILVCGHAGCGKTAILEKLIYNSHEFPPAPYCPTIEDTYVAMIETERGVKEKVRIYEVGGSTANGKLEKHYIMSSDAVVIVYDVNQKESFTTAEHLKATIDRNRRDTITIVLCGNKTDLSGEKKAVDSNDVIKWAQKEKVKFFETSATNRLSLLEVFTHTATKMTPPQPKSIFGTKKEGRA